MNIKLENDLLEVIVDSNGAEVISIKGKKDSIEYLWKAEPKYWGRHAPILFPIVGRLKDDKYRINEKEFALTQHGFARDCEFDLVEKSSNYIMYRLRSSEEILKKYPYKFELYVKYILNENNLEIKYKVINTDDKKIYFSIGSHPGFTCPLLDGESIEDYYLEFNKKENAKRDFLNKELRLYTGESKVILKDTNILNLSKTLFTDDAVVFKNLESTKVSLKNDKNSKVITIDFKEFPYLAVWSRPNEAPFICIEPWVGYADSIDFNGEFTEKSGIISLEVKKEFDCKYNVLIEQ